MDRANIRASILKIMHDEMGIQAHEVDDSKDFSDLGMDSLDAVNLWLHLEDTFNVKVRDSKAEECKNIGNLVDFLVGVVTV